MPGKSSRDQIRVFIRVTRVGMNTISMERLRTSLERKSWRNNSVPDKYVLRGRQYLANCPDGQLLASTTTVIRGPVLTISLCHVALVSLVSIHSEAGI